MGRQTEESEMYYNNPNVRIIVKQMSFILSAAFYTHYVCYARVGLTDSGRISL